MQCPKCGAPINEQAHFCEKCGFMLKVPSPKTFIPRKQTRPTVVAETTKYRKRVLLFSIGTVVIAAIAFAILLPTKTHPDFLCAVTKIVQNGVVAYRLDIFTEPETDLEYKSRTYKTNTDGAITIVVPSRLVPLKLSQEKIFLTWHDKKTEETVWIDNAAEGFSFFEVGSNIKVTRSGQVLFSEDIYGIRNHEIKINSRILDSPSPGIYHLDFDVSGVSPKKRPHIDTMLQISIHQNPGTLQEGYLDARLLFPPTSIEFKSAYGTLVKWQGGDVVKFSGSSINIKGKVTQSRENNIEGKITVQGIPVQVGIDGSFKANLNELELGRNEILFEAEADGHRPTSKTLIAIREPTNAERIAEYRRDAKKLSYAMFSKNPERYKGTHIVVLGRVFTIQEAENSTFMQVYLSFTGSIYNLEDQIIVTYDQQTDFVKDNFVWVCGTIQGNYTYTSVAGYTITAPHIVAEHLGKFEGTIGDALRQMLKRPF